MATLSEWLAGETADGKRLPAGKVAAYRERHGLPPIERTTSPQAPQRQIIAPIRHFTRGPGTHMKLLLKEFGISADLCGEGCGSFAAAMDQWGVDGCRQNRDKIKERLLQKYKETTWMTSVNAAFQSVWSGNVFRMDVLHPVDWLIDEAIRRALKESKPGCPVTVVVTTHNYARYLGEALDSIAASTVAPASVLVLDDASDDDPASVCRSRGVTCDRVEFRDVHLVRRHGLRSVQSKYVLFLDADNMLDPDYLESCVSLLENDREAAFAFPVLQGFGDKTGPMYGTDAAPDYITAKDIERWNRCDTGSVIRTEVLRQTLALECPPTVSRATQDWRMFRNLLRAGPWHGVKAVVPLLYRVHPDQASKREKASYYGEADLEHETVTIVIPFSGRWNTWGPLREWLLTQTWPQEQTRLLVVNTTHSHISAGDLGLSEWTGAGVAIERLDVGRPKLADEDRRNRPDTQRAVEAAVAGIFNRASMLAWGEYILTLEDDVIPHRPDAIDRLMREMTKDTAAVSGLYRHRYDDRACVFHVPYRRGELIPMDGPLVESVGGTGFGCLLVRRSVMLEFPMSGDHVDRPHYDIDFATRCHEAGYKWTLCRDVPCDHLTGV